MRWKFSERERELKKRESLLLCFIWDLSQLFSALSSGISILTIYCRAIDGIAKWLCTAVFATHCGLYSVCNNHIGGQSDTVTKNCLETKQNKEYRVDWILWSSDWLFCFTFLFNFSSLLENVQLNVTYLIGHCYGVELSLGIIKPSIRDLRCEV